MNIIRVLECLVIMCGVILIYDARPITKKVFSFGEKNETVKAIKITGFILTIIGGLMMIIF